jgi:hypothetical protein
MGRRSRRAEVEAGVSTFLRQRGAPNPDAVLAAGPALASVCDREGLLGYRASSETGTIGEGLEEINKLRPELEAAGERYVEHGRASRDLYYQALAKYVGAVIGVGELMHHALLEAGIDPFEEVRKEQIKENP